VVDLKRFWDKGLLYEGHKIVPFCPRCETSLSSHEVSLATRTSMTPRSSSSSKDGQRRQVPRVDDDAVDSGRNAALAVGPYYDYARVSHKGETLVLAEALLGALHGPYEVLDRFKGETLVGSRYEPLFDFFAGAEKGFIVHGADFVSLEDAPGLSTSPPLRRGRLPAPRERGRPAPPAGDAPGDALGRDRAWAGLWDQGRRPQDHPEAQGEGSSRERDDPARVPVLLALLDRARLLRAPVLVHPDDRIQERMIAANQSINWIPKEVGREPVRQLASKTTSTGPLSRERYWGTRSPSGCARRAVTARRGEHRGAPKNGPRRPGGLEARSPSPPRSTVS